MENRVERVVLETDRYRVEGDLTLPREGFRSRLTDYLNRADLAFIPLTDVVVSALAGSDRDRSHDYLAVAVDHVELAYPHESSGA
jgi:hypothetical protein